MLRCVGSKVVRQASSYAPKVACLNTGVGGDSNEKVAQGTEVSRYANKKLREVLADIYKGKDFNKEFTGEQIKSIQARVREIQGSKMPADGNKAAIMKLLEKMSSAVGSGHEIYNRIGALQNMLNFGLDDQKGVVESPVSLAGNSFDLQEFRSDIVTAQVLILQRMSKVVDLFFNNGSDEEKKRLCKILGPHSRWLGLRPSTLGMDNAEQLEAGKNVENGRYFFNPGLVTELCGDVKKLLADDRKIVGLDWQAGVETSLKIIEALANRSYVDMRVLVQGRKAPFVYHSLDNAEYFRGMAEKVVGVETVRAL